MISLLLAVFCLQEPVQIPLPEAVRHSPTLSPDGAWVYYFQSLEKKPENFRKYARNEALFRTTLDGKTVQKIIEVGDTRGRLHWSPEGTRIFVTRRVADTNGDGEIGFGDGMSLVSSDQDGNNIKDLRAASPDTVTIYTVTPAGELVLGLRNGYRESNPRIVLLAPGKEEKPLAKAWAYYPLDGKTGMIRTIKVDQNEDGEIDFRDVGSLSFLNLETKESTPFEVAQVIRAPLMTPSGLVFAQLQKSGETKKIGLRENSAVMSSDRTGMNVKALTDAEFIWIPLHMLESSVLLHRTRGKETEFGLLSREGEWKTLWKAPEGEQVGFPRISKDRKSLLFAVLKDGNGDGKLTPGEDPSYILKMDLE